MNYIDLDHVIDLLAIPDTLGGCFTPMCSKCGKYLQDNQIAYADMKDYVLCRKCMK